MDLDFKDIITLDDDNKYVIVSKAQYNSINYIYLIDINNNSNIKFARVEKDDSLTELDKDDELVAQLIPIFYQNGIDSLK